MRICTKCKQEKPATAGFFYRNRGGKYGLTPRCKQCVNEDNRLSHERRMQDDPDRVRRLATERSRRWYQRDLDRARKVSRESAARALRDPVKAAVIRARKRGGYARLRQEEIDRLFEQQGRKCAICLSEDPGSKSGWNLDHCHASGSVRFILCAHCNRGLGAFRDRPDLLRAAADALEAIHE